MRILYLAYWGVNDGLTVSVINPQLKLLVSYTEVHEILLVTIERDGNAEPKHLDFTGNHKITHLPLVTRNYKPNILNKINDFILFPKLLTQILKSYAVDKAITHGMISGSLLYMTCYKRKTPFYVFAEPHSQYMLQSGVWKRYDPRYLFQRHWESQQIHFAERLWSVTENYRKVLLDLGVDEFRLALGPNAVDLEQFSFSKESRKKIRENLGIDEQEIVGIYVGKFGGIYLKEDAFEIFDACLSAFQGKFRLLILSPQERNEILELSQQSKVQSSMIIKKVDHNEVPAYLSAADFGFSMQNPKPSNLYLCPLKNGEYWASGLPILSIADVGDDTSIMEKEGGGAVFRLGDKTSVDKALEIIKVTINQAEDRSSNRSFHLAKKYRSITTIEKIFDDLVSENFDKKN